MTGIILLFAIVFLFHQSNCLGYCLCRTLITVSGCCLPIFTFKKCMKSLDNSSVRACEAVMSLKYCTALGFVDGLESCLLV